MQINAQDTQDLGTYGRPIKPGTYPVNIIQDKEHESAKGNACILLTLLVDAPDDAAPGGKVKIDHYVTPKQFSMKNFLEIFPHPIDPATKSVTITGGLRLGKRLTAVIGMRPEKRNPDGTVQYASKAEVIRLAPKGPKDTGGDMVVAPPEPATGDDGIPF